MNAPYQDPGQMPRWMKALQWLNKSFRLGRFFSVNVFVYWIAVILLPLIFAAEYHHGGFRGMELLTYALLTSFLLLFVVWTHEMGHILAARRYGIQTPLITLGPLGGLAHLATPAPNAKADIRISLAGPLVHVPWILLCWAGTIFVPADFGRPEGWWIGPIYFFSQSFLWLNIVMCAFNLLPLFPLDGGRVLRAWLSQRTHPGRATLIACRVGILGAGAMVLVGLLGLFGLFGATWWGFILALIGVSNYFACRREMTMAKHTLSPYTGDQREAWQADPEAWKSGGGEQVSGPTRSERRATRREAQKTERSAERRESLRAEVDRLLDKVSDVGMAGLSASERKALTRASKELQRGS